MTYIYHTTNKDQLEPAHTSFLKTSMSEIHIHMAQSYKTNKVVPDKILMDGLNNQL